MIHWFKKSQRYQAVIQPVFAVSLATFLVLFTVEYLEPGFVTNWFNPAWLLGLVIISGLMATQNYD